MKFPLVVSDISYRLDYKNDKYMSVSLTTPRPENTDERAYPVDYMEPMPQVTLYYNGSLEDFKELKLGEVVNVTVG